MKLNRPLFFVILSFWVSLPAFAQEPEESKPTIHNQLKIEGSSERADGSVAPTSGGGAMSASGFRVVASGVGYAFSGGSPDFNYGAEITPPLEDLEGEVLTLAEARSYWRPSPVRPGERIRIAGDIGAMPVPEGFVERYYYSPHAGRVFATQTGNISVTWVTAKPTNHPTQKDYETLQRGYTIGFGTSLATRRMYWTEVGHQGPRVQVPTGIIQDLTILYNDRFPRTVPADERKIPFGVDQSLVPDTTFWYDPTLEMLRAYNAEGRVIVEYLGRTLGTADEGRREHLGLEIVEVRRVLNPVTVETIIGEQLLPSSEPGVLEDDTDFSPVQVSAAGPPLAQHFVDNRTVYYGVEENLQAPKVEFYWLEEGTHTVRWPRFRNYYMIKWPEGVEGFAGVFARPSLGTPEDDVAATFLNLSATNTPELVFQDDPRGLEAALSFQFNLSVALDSGGDGVNRSLIRFNSGNDFWYLRLYSATVEHLSALDVEGAHLDPENPRDFRVTAGVKVGQRIAPPHASLALGGYIDPVVGDAYHPGAYVNPFDGGGLEAAADGAIIPVNALPGRDRLRIWWFRELRPPASVANVFKSIHVPAVLGEYTITYPTDAREIVMASNAGTGELVAEQANGEIYFQNDPGEPGYNPNEEHAIMLGGRAYALRDDLNVPGISSDPFVLVSHQDPAGRPDMSVFKVLRENDEYRFDYPALAGRLLQAPMPLPVIPQPLDEQGVSRNREVMEDIDPVLEGPPIYNLIHYNQFTFQDRKGATWVYRGPHQPQPGDDSKVFHMTYYYPTLDGFAFPNADNGVDEAPPLGTVVPYLRRNGSSEDPVTGSSLKIAFRPKWPENVPVLNFGETLAKPKFGLPQILGQRSLQLVYQQSIALDFQAAQNSVVLYDATVRRMSLLEDIPGFAALPGSVPTTSSRGKVYFQLLPSHLEERLYFDDSIGKQGALVFEGRFHDELVGEDYVSLNTFSPEDVEIIKQLCDDGDSHKAEWDTLIDRMTVTPGYRARDAQGVELAKPLTYTQWLAREGISEVIGQNIKATYGPTELPEIASPDQAVNGYFLSAIGGGEGYVTLATGNGLVNSEEGEPVAFHVIRVGGDLYRGELKALVASNPLSEKVTVQHTGDFAARPEEYEFQWRKAPPVDGLAPAVSVIHHTNLGELATGDVARNISSSTGMVEWGPEEEVKIPFEGHIYEEGSDRSVPGLRLTTTLDFTGDLAGNKRLNRAFLSLRLVDGDGAIVNVNGQEALRYGALNGEDTVPADDVPVECELFLTHGRGCVVFALPAYLFKEEEPNTIEILLSTTKEVGEESIVDLRVSLEIKEDRSANFTLFATTAGKNRHVVSGAGIDTLSDHYYIMRYRPLQAEHPLYRGSDPTWSDWTQPALVEGWIKRVLAGINPFNQRLSDFFENAVDTNVSMISQAGPRWEGDVALNLDAVQDAGLIEIYETVLKRGINLSIDGNPAVDYGPANDALLLAAGYLNDLYVALGNEAFADAANPMVHFDSQALGALGAVGGAPGFEETFRSTATARFSFQGQVASLLDEELGLLRGRDDFLSPSIETPPVYNRLFWNYTRGIDAGELVYALNYNIREQSDAVADGKVDAADAARMFPQAHGDAYGHYLTAVKNYYRLLTNPEFTWGTRIEAVTVLGQPVSIDYFDERKFAGSAAALARTANQVVSLERRKAFESADEGWERLEDGRYNERTGTRRHWGVDDWAARGAQGAYFHWVVGNALLPEKDLLHEGIQKIDRGTVPELDAIAKAAEKMQNQLEAADSKVNPLDLTDDSLLFDISPADLAGGKTHFEQIYVRATAALKNASAVFQRAADSTRLLRSTENQSHHFTQVIDDEEAAFRSQLTEIFGDPYPGDVGPGKVYPQGYEGPDIVRFMAIDRPFDVFASDELFAYEEGELAFTLNVKDSLLIESLDKRNSFTIQKFASEVKRDGRTVSYTLRENQGPYVIVNPSMGKRPRLGTLQNALNEVRLAEEQLYVGLQAMHDDREGLFDTLEKLEKEIGERYELKFEESVFQTAQFLHEEVLVAIGAIRESFQLVTQTREQIVEAAVESLPTIVGVSSDVSAPARGALLATAIGASAPITAAEISAQQAGAVADFVFILAKKAMEVVNMTIEEKAYVRDQIQAITELYEGSLARTREVDALTVSYARALERYRTELAKGRSILADREVFRRRAAAAVQGYRTRDIAFRTFRTEALEDYQTLLDWASRYAFLAAQAYDYETGLLGSSKGQAFLGQIISSRALGVFDDDGNPTLSASNSGDPGLSGLLTKLKSDYDVVKGRLGFNNPETNGTTFSLRREFFRIPGTPEGDVAWQQVLESLVLPNLLTDADVATHAMQLGGAEAAAQSGFLIDFPTVIEEGKNFFGKDLLAGDSKYTSSHFATKISSLGVVFEGYHGMAPCPICQSGQDHSEVDALSATPYVYLIPAGLDTMRTPPLGDAQGLRQWAVQDYAMPLPFDLGHLEPSQESIQGMSDRLRATYRAPRRHPAFRATDIVEYFYTNLAADYTSSRLVGRSVWNSSWKLAIPARGLLSDESEGIARFVRSVKDIKLHLKTYAYSGN